MTGWRAGKLRQMEMSDAGIKKTKSACQRQDMPGYSGISRDSRPEHEGVPDMVRQNAPWGHNFGPQMSFVWPMARTWFTLMR